VSFPPILDITTDSAGNLTIKAPGANVQPPNTPNALTINVDANDKSAIVLTNPTGVQPAFFIQWNGTGTGIVIGPVGKTGMLIGADGGVMLQDAAAQLALGTPGFPAASGAMAHNTIMASPPAGGATITLPTPNHDGALIIVKNWNGAGTLTISPPGGYTIDGATTFTSGHAGIYFADVTNQIWHQIGAV